MTSSGITPPPVSVFIFMVVGRFESPFPASETTSGLFVVELPPPCCIAESSTSLLLLPDAIRFASSDASRTIR
eukprot:CAMPEP_0170153804 /NCGR_PEP_ID=MMETSP0033_2-20121228/56268_1 /TAXON_ID=195969 /ORGANISM="Dolichomastix tenuilepis, Strain CCMP3274" /LENGTH=72 /DNA_ID=CAMNT_0010391025 /DNA_START=78 /DNA_END=296 /DNA_ORIENTATION=+